MATKAKMTRAKPADEFDAVYRELRAIVEPYARHLAIAQQSDRVYYLQTRDAAFRGKPLWFGGVRRGKAYVSFHLIPLYACPEMVKDLSPELRKRMQGKGCLNFKKVDPALFAELASVTRAGFERFRTMDWSALEKKMEKKR